MAAIDIISKEDLQQFRDDLLREIKLILTTTQEVKEWLKGSEVRRLLKVSAGTLQNLRIKGKLKCSKIGKIYYYRNDDILQLLHEHN